MPPAIRTSSPFSNLTNVGAIEVNAFQSIADVVIQKSIREGFGLVVAEALWKARPVGQQGGRHPDADHGGGILIDTIPEAASACVKPSKTPTSPARWVATRQGACARALPDPTPDARQHEFFAKLLGV